MYMQLALAYYPRFTNYKTSELKSWNREATEKAKKNKTKHKLAIEWEWLEERVQRAKQKYYFI